MVVAEKANRKKSGCFIKRRGVTRHERQQYIEKSIIFLTTDNNIPK
jgi:hypothetical protein